MLTDELDYELPPELIAQDPIEPRDAARLLVSRGVGVEPLHGTIAELPALIRPGDVVVVNETRVLPSRVAVRRSTGGAGEVLLIAPRPGKSPGDRDDLWEALCRPSRKLVVGETVTAQTGRLAITMVEALGEGRWHVVPHVDGRPVSGDALIAALGESGEMPLPPYIEHRLVDAERYQTVFSRRAASVAAPTAGLHFTDAVIKGIRDRGAELVTVELVVGLDTFRPITGPTVEGHEIHTEWYNVPPGTWSAVAQAGRLGGRVIAVGTTSVRALESAAATGLLHGDTTLFITPGFNFRVVDLLLTNFHMPRTTLLAMIQAFTGPHWRDLYRVAVRERYRFLSFGDAMLLTRSDAATQGGQP